MSLDDGVNQLQSDPQVFSKVSRACGNEALAKRLLKRIEDELIKRKLHAEELERKRQEEILRLEVIIGIIIIIISPNSTYLTINKEIGTKRGSGKASKRTRERKESTTSSAIHGHLCGRIPVD